MKPVFINVTHFNDEAAIVRLNVNSVRYYFRGSNHLHTTVNTSEGGLPVKESPDELDRLIANALK